MATEKQGKVISGFDAFNNSKDSGGVIQNDETDKIIMRSNVKVEEHNLRNLI